MKTIFAVALAASVALTAAACQTQQTGGPVAAGADALGATAGSAIAIAGVAVKGVARGDMTGAIAPAAPAQPVGTARRRCGRWGHDAEGHKMCLAYS